MQVVTGDNQLVILGGHAKDCQVCGAWAPPLPCWASGEAGRAFAAQHHLRRRQPSPHSSPLCPPWALCPRLQYFRQYSPAGDSLQVGLMSSARWYPGVGTLADGKLLIVGGSGKSGDAGYHAQERPENDNPTYEVYDPESR